MFFILAPTLRRDARQIGDTSVSIKLLSLALEFLTLGHCFHCIIAFNIGVTPPKWQLTPDYVASAAPTRRLAAQSWARWASLLEINLTLN